MSQRMSISEIKKILSRTDDPAMIKSFLQDDRKGVQQLIESWKKRQVKKKALLAKTSKLYNPIKAAHQDGFQFVAGIDEAGRGPLAGPVVAACVILPLDPMLHVDDSKKLSEKKREVLYDEIVQHAISFGLGFVPPTEIDELNIYRAARKAMLLAFEACRPQKPDYCFIDAMTIPDLDVPQKSLIKGDAICAAISAASILAKVTRDRIMVEAAEAYPHYGFDSNKGYGARHHLDALEKHGPCPIHRITFAPVKDYVLPSVSFFETMLKRSTSLVALRDVGERIKRASGDLTDDELENLREFYRHRREQILGKA